MSRFYPLQVTDVQNTIRDAIVVTLDAPKDEFEFIPGQYLTFRTNIEGVEVRRSYSICAGRSDGKLQVGIKRVAGGAFSSWANDNLKPGDLIEAMPPMGNFHVPLGGAERKNYLGFAGGSGITPVLSILKTVLEDEPNSHFTLIYANRAVNTIMFREELEDIKNRYLGRFTVIHVLETEAQDIDLFTGRVDAQKCEQLFASWVNLSHIRTAFICGPEPMMLTIAESLKAHGLSEEQIKFELFASSQPGRLPKRVADAAEKGDATYALSVTIDGTTRFVEAKRDTSVLDAALGANLDAPYACKGGVCSTCKCRVIEGEVEMVTNHALEDYEVEKGFVLSCQSYPVTDKVVVTYDEH